MGSLIIALFYALTTLLLGWIFIRLFSLAQSRSSSFNHQALFSTSFMLGQGIFATVWLFLGLAAQFKPSLIISLLILSFLTGLYFSKNLYEIFITQVRQTCQTITKLSLIWKIILLVLFCAMCLYGMAAVIFPPLGDAEAFYMVLPKIMAASFRLKPQSNYYTFSQIGLFGEMHHAALMSIISAQAAKTFVWLTGFAIVNFMLALCTEAGVGTRGKIIALVMLFTSSTFTFHLYDGKVDIFAAALGLGACYWALQTNKNLANKNPNLLPYILTGLFSGLSCVAKFSYIPVIFSAVFLIVVWNHWKCLFQLKTFRLFGMIGFMMLIGIVPHFIKNMVLFNEPFAPFYFFKPGGSNWTEQVWYTPETIRYILLTYPIALTFGKYSLLGGNLSPLILLFIPLFLLKKREGWKPSKELFQMSVAAVACLLIWMICRPSVLCPRCILPTVLLFIPITAWCAEKVIISRNHNLLKLSIFSSLIISMYVTFAMVIFGFPNKEIISKFTHCVKSNYRELKCDRYFDPKKYPSSWELANGLAYINQTANLGDRVFVLGYYTYFLRADLLQCLNGREKEYDIKGYDPENRWVNLFNGGFKYFVVQDNKSFEVGDIPSWLKVSKVYEDPRTKVYTISSRDSQHKPQYSTRQNPYPAWEIISLT